MELCERCETQICVCDYEVSTDEINQYLADTGKEIETKTEQICTGCSADYGYCVCHEFLQKKKKMNLDDRIDELALILGKEYDRTRNLVYNIYHNGYAKWDRCEQYGFNNVTDDAKRQVIRDLESAAKRFQSFK